MQIVLIVFLLSFILFVLFMLAVKGRDTRNNLSSFRGWNYAHRGLYGNGVPENSLQAFANARNAGYGSELDVHLLKDGTLAVIHDSKLFRMTGREGVVEDLTSSELSSCYLDGSAYTIPLFSDVLKIYDGAAPLIVELKPTENNVDQLCKTTCDMLDGYNGIYCLESFDPRCVMWLKKNRPDLIRGQLYMNYFKSETSSLPWYLKFLLRHQLFNFITKPDFVAYQYEDRITISNYIVRKFWNMPCVSWTLKTQEEYDTAVAEGSIPIFENIKP